MILVALEETNGSVASKNLVCSTLVRAMDRHNSNLYSPYESKFLLTTSPNYRYWLICKFEFTSAKCNSLLNPSGLGVYYIDAFSVFQVSRILKLVFWVFHDILF